MQARSRATIEAVLSAAAHILESGGIAAFNTNAVAERAGCSIGSLYQYFPNKDAILVALIERRAQSFAENMESLVQTMDGAVFADDLRRLLTQAIAWHDEAARLSRILDAEEERLGPALDLCNVKDRMDAILVQMAARHDAEFAGCDPTTFVRPIAAICKAVMEAEGASPNPHWPLAIDRTIAAVMGYLSVPAAFAKVASATDLANDR